MEPEAYRDLYRLERDHWWYCGMRRITAKLLDREVSQRPDLTILDAGCGTGGNLSALSARGRVVGFDFSSLALSYAQRAHGNQIARADVTAIPYPSNTFDLVTSFDVLHSQGVLNAQAALRELARVTRPGGTVLLRVPALEVLRGPHDGYTHGQRRYTAHELRAMLGEAGLLVRYLTYANSLLLLPVLIIRKIGCLRVRLGGKLAPDIWPTPGPVNQLLLTVLAFEAEWIGSGHSFPVGVSLFALATKPGPAH